MAVKLWPFFSHAVAGCTASMVWRRAWRGGESSDADVARSCWYLYSVAVISLCTVWIMDSLKCLWHSDGLLPVKAVLVMLQVSLEGMGASELRLMMVGICCRNDWRVG